MTKKVPLIFELFFQKSGVLSSCPINARGPVILGLEHAKSRGTLLGRPKTRDDQKIKALHKNGLTDAQIQKTLVVNQGAVCRALDG
jgi:hypothetical protein